MCAAGGAPWPNGEPGPGDHLRKVFYRMGLNDEEIVALSGNFIFPSLQGNAFLSAMVPGALQAVKGTEADAMATHKDIRVHLLAISRSAAPAELGASGVEMTCTKPVCCC